MTLHDVTRMNDEAHGHAQVYNQPLGCYTVIRGSRVADDRYIDS